MAIVSASSWSSCGSQQLGESVWSPILAQRQPLIFSTCYWGLLTATVDNRIRCSYLMSHEVFCQPHLGPIPWHSLVTVLLLSSIGYSLDAHSLSLACAFRMFGIQIVNCPLFFLSLPAGTFWMQLVYACSSMTKAVAVIWAVIFVLVFYSFFH